ncbi:MAG: amino acid adenylation domain-containing protein, partial [Dehalococcoidia bacterium]
MLILQNTATRRLSFPGLGSAPFQSLHNSAIMDLTLYMRQVDGVMHAGWEYSTDLFDRATIERMAAHFELILEQATADPDLPLSELSLLTPQEQAALEAANDTAAAYPESDTIPALFLQQLEKTPNAVAFTHNGRTTTYAQLAERAAAIQKLLLERGLGPGDVAAVSLPRSFDLVAALLAVLACGAAYLPLDPAYPEERLAFMLDDAGAAALVTNRDLEPALPAHPHTLLIESASRRSADALSRSFNDPLPRLLPDSPAYIIYTSGSTGQPKGVSIPHRQIANRLHWMWSAYPFQDGEVGCQRTALSFVDSIWEIFGYLLQGLPTAILDDDTVKDPRTFVDALAANRVSRLWLVPSLLRTLLESHADLAARLPGLRFWVTTGETIPRELFERFTLALPDAQLFNLYGTSEVWDATWWLPDPAFSSFNVPIGRPLPNVTAYILDEHLNPLPPGIPGALFIGGHSLAHGYLKRPALTAERFIPNPFGPPGSRLYDTGDLARFLPSGDIEFIGRRDFQVKLRGLRIELGEIEAVLAELPAVLAAAVAVRDERLAAYFVPNPEAGQPSSEDLRGELKRRLPAHMLPASFTPLEALPLTPSGKVDRLRLPDPLAPDTSAGFIAPRSPAEARLAAIFADVLGLEQVGVHHDFFDLGG